VLDQGRHIAAAVARAILDLLADLRDGAALPHWAIPHPNLVPVRPRLSRSTHSNGVSPTASTSRAWPLTLSWNAIGGISSPLMPT
jgi:hypothetical protein